MNSRSFIILVVAVLIGLGAMRLSQQLLASSRKGAEDTQEVVVAARDFKEEEILKPDMVKVIRMARSAIPPNSFSAAKDVEDRWVRTTMLEGDVLVEKKLGPKGTPPGLVANIPPGMRAVAIDVTEQSGVSGFILPGHHVDVVRFENSEKEKNDGRGETILQDVLVLAAGQLFSRPEERAVQSRTVTLALSPGDVHILVAARAKGALSLSLRGVNDHAMVEAKTPEPKSDPEAEQRLKLAEDARQKAENELRLLKEEQARKPAEPKASRPRPAPRIATIYRGIGNKRIVILDDPGVSKLAPDETSPIPDVAALGMQRGFGSGSATPDDETEP
jgi:pilus assembly protein CpaB